MDGWLPLLLQGLNVIQAATVDDVELEWWVSEPAGTAAGPYGQLRVPVLVDLMMRCLAEDSRARPGLNDIMAVLESLA